MSSVLMNETERECVSHCADIMNSSKLSAFCFSDSSILPLLTFTLSSPMLCLLVLQCHSRRSFPCHFPHSSPTVPIPSFRHRFLHSLNVSTSVPSISLCHLYCLLFFYIFPLSTPSPPPVTRFLSPFLPPSPLFPPYQKYLPMGQACLFTFE